MKTYSHKMKLFVAILLTVPLFVFADRPRNTPPAVEVQSALSSVNSSVTEIYVSSDFVVPQGLESRLHPNSDLGKTEADAIRQLVDDTSVPNSQKRIHLIRYELGDPFVDAQLVRAIKAGIPTTVVTDSNPSYKATKASGDKNYNSNFSEWIPRSANSAGVRSVNALLEAGLVVGQSLFFQPVYVVDESNDDERVPIMHEKCLVLQAGDKITSFIGTNNYPRNARYNVTHKLIDPLIGKHMVQHIEALAATYAHGGETKDIPDMAPLKILYPDGALTLAYTDGKFLPNDKLAVTLAKGFSEVIASEFVITHRATIKALLEVLKANDNARVFIIGDDRFANATEWGLEIVTEGYTVFPPAGPSVFGYPEKVTKQIEAYVYQRQAINPDTNLPVDETIETGPPVARHVWHDKTLMAVLPDGSVALFTGSMNLSGNFANAEIQAQFDLPGDSWIAAATRARIMGTVEKEKGIYALPVNIATIRNEVGVITNHTDLEVPVELAEKLHDGFLNRDLAVIRTQLERMINIESKLISKLSVEQKRANVKAFVDFVAWYFDKVPASAGLSPEARIRKTLEIALIQGVEQLNDRQRVAIIRDIFWRPNLNDDQQLALIKESLPLLGLERLAGQFHPRGELGQNARGTGPVQSFVDTSLDGFPDLSSPDFCPEAYGLQIKNQKTIDTDGIIYPM